MARFEEIKDYLSKRDDADEIILFTSPSYDTAILGISSDGNVIYSYTKMVVILLKPMEWVRKRLWSSLTTIPSEQLTT